MTVLDLIKILQSHDPEAVVVVPTYNDRSDVSNALGLEIGGVRAVNLRAVIVKAAWFDPDHNARIFEIDDDGAIDGVEVG